MDGGHSCYSLGLGPMHTEKRGPGCTLFPINREYAVTV